MLKKPADPFWQNKKESMAYRLHIAWENPYYRCDENTINFVSVDFHRHEHNHNEDSWTWSHPIQDKFYEILTERNEKKYVTKKNLKVSAEISQGCLAHLTLKLVSVKVKV